MAIYPGAVFKPTTWGGKTKRNRQGRGILHVAVSERVSYPPFSGNTWHFYVAKNGYCEQYVDTDFCAWASVDANDDALSIETAGAATPAVVNSEPWTPEQCARIADIMRWEASQPGGAPLELLPDSKPGRRGWGPHRLGIKHSAGPRPGWWQPGGEVWSSALGKECPGDAKVAQVPGIIAMARSGAPMEDDMPLTDRISVRGGSASVTVGEALAAAYTVFDALFNGGTSTPGGKPLVDVLGELLSRQPGAAPTAPGSPGPVMSKTDIQDAVREVLREGVGS